MFAAVHGARAERYVARRIRVLAPETTAAQPAQTATANITKADFEGKVSLPYDVKCGNQNLKAGQYVLSVKSEGTGRVVTINGGGQDMNMQAREVPVESGGYRARCWLGSPVRERKLAA